MPTLYEVNGETHIKNPDTQRGTTFCGDSFEESDMDSVKSFAMYLQDIPFDGNWCDDCYNEALNN